jgi:hypothetical protein
MAHSDQYLENYKFSASQIENWSGCMRRGGFTYLLELRGRGTPSTDLGGDIPPTLEHYQRYGTEIDTTTLAGAVAIVAIPFIPTGMVAEGEFEFHSGRHLWRGFKDLRSPGRVIDYKTTKDFKWAKTPEVLMTDPQAMLYAASEFVADPDLDAAELTWLYLRTTPPHKPKEVHLRVVRHYANRAMSALDDIADGVMQVVRAAQGLDDQPLRDYVLSLPYNSNECFKYNKPCDFSGLCNLTPSERFAGKMSQAQDSLFARLRAQNAAEDEPALPRLAVGQSIGPILPGEPDVFKQAAINPPEYQPPPATTPEQDKKLAKEQAAAAKLAEKAVEKAAKQAAKTSPDVTKAAQEAVQATKSSGSVTPVIHNLLIGCVTSQPSVDFSEIVQRAKSIIKAEAGVDDWRFIQYTAAGVLSQAVTKALDDFGPIHTLIVDPRMAEFGVCIGLLKSRATTIVMGVT